MWSLRLTARVYVAVTQVGFHESLCEKGAARLAALEAAISHCPKKLAEWKDTASKRTLAMYACKEDNKEALDALLAMGEVELFINEVDTDGKTALRMCLKIGADDLDFQMAAELLKHGADVRILSRAPLVSHHVTQYHVQACSHFPGCTPP